MAEAKKRKTAAKRQSSTRRKSKSAALRDDIAALKRVKALHDDIHRELDKVIVGQHEIIHLLLTALLSDGHCLLVGVPGLAKTLLVSSLARVLAVDFNRIQFTPDLMPADITGSDIIVEKRGSKEFSFIPGPVFANIVLADEINRTPPKTQAALLQAMQERHVTYSGTTYPLSLPFFVLATQNPIEQEGTYPLPEAQLDRFLFDLRMEYPAQEEEMAIVRNSACADQDIDSLTSVISGEELLELQQFVKKRFPIADTILEVCVQLVRQTRPADSEFDFVRDNLSWGAGPRAGAFLVLAAKASAALNGKETVDYDDIRRVAVPVLRHRLMPNYQAEAEGIYAESIIRRLLNSLCS